MSSSNRTLLPLVIFALIACNDSLAPFQPEITNATDNFQLQATDVTNLTNTFDFTWQNTGTMANVNQATTIAAGSATLTIFDAQNVQVYTRNLADNGTFQTAAGSTGAWMIRMVLTNYSGTLNFRVQKNP